MSYVIGETVQTQNGNALCMGFKEHDSVAIFELPNGDKFDLKNAERKIKKKKYISESVSQTVRLTVREKVESLDKTIAEAKAKLAALKNK